jgi:predicted  nucleic acid-binding Zn-ribbon protein
MRARIQAGSRGLMNSELQNLLELQQVDARIAAVRAEVAALPKEVARIESKLAGSKAAVKRRRRR